MKVGINIQMRTSVPRLDDFFNKATDIMRGHVIKALSEMADRYDRMIRERGEGESWQDHSGNLRSSVGAAVYDKGKVMFQTAFSTVMRGAEGSRKGRQMVQELASEYTDVIALAVFAAMDYAEVVEAIDSKDVIASAAIYAEKEAAKVIKKAMGEAELDIQLLADKL